MQIHLKSVAVVGAVQLPAGDYWVSDIIEGGHIQLTGGGKTFKLQAIKRPLRNHKVKRSQITFIPNGGALWTIAVTTKQGEFLVNLTLK